MLPRSCLRLADSKSNSSTRLPRRTTTRVSSGWVASMSILFGIEYSLDGRHPRRRPAAPWRQGRAARLDAWLIVVERMDLQRVRVPRISVAPRRGVAAMVIGLALEARS